MPRRLRQYQENQQRQKLINLALRGGYESSTETRKILETTFKGNRIERLLGSGNYLPWVEAAGRGHTEILRQYLTAFGSSSNTFLDAEDPDNESALLAAVKGHQYHTVAILLSAGATATKQVLTEAILLDSSEILFLLSHAELDFNECHLIQAITYSCANSAAFLLGEGIVPSETTAMRAYHAKQHDLVAKMVAGGVDYSQLVHEACKYNQSDAFCAILTRNIRLVEPLSKVESPDFKLFCRESYCRFLKDKYRSTTVQEQDLQLIKRIFLFYEYDEKELNFLTIKEYCMNRQVLELLLEAKMLNQTLLDSVLGIAVIRLNHDCVHMLISHGANVTAVAYDGETPLIHAVRYLNYNAVKLLLEKGADIHGRGRQDATALHWAAYKAYPGWVKMLLSVGANPFLETTYGHSSFAVLHKTLEARILNGANRQDPEQCIRILERQCLLPYLFWSNNPASPFRLLSGLGNETSEWLFNHIADFLCDPIS